MSVSRLSLGPGGQWLHRAVCAHQQDQLFPRTEAGNLERESRQAPAVSEREAKAQRGQAPAPDHPAPVTKTGAAEPLERACWASTALSGPRGNLLKPTRGPWRRAASLRVARGAGGDASFRPAASAEALRRAGRHRAVLPGPPQPHGAHQGAAEKVGAAAGIAGQGGRRGGAPSRTPPPTPPPRDPGQPFPPPHPQHGPPTPHFRARARPRPRTRPPPRRLPGAKPRPPPSGSAPWAVPVLDLEPRTLSTGSHRVPGSGFEPGALVPVEAAWSLGPAQAQASCASTAG